MNRFFAGDRIGPYEVVSVGTISLRYRRPGSTKTWRSRISDIDLWMDLFGHYRKRCSLGGMQ